MKDSYYISGSERSQRVHQLFEHIARRYDLVNDIQSLGFHRLWKRKLISLAVAHAPITKDSPPQALDLCCGTGDISMALAQQHFQVHGVDFSGEMLAVAQYRAQKRNIPNIRWTLHDVLQWDDPPNTYDLITCVYGLRNLADIPGAIELMYRWLKPGGQLLILDFGKPTNPLLKFLFRLYLKLVVPLFGLAFCHDRKAYSYILNSLDAYPAQKGVHELLKKTGFEKSGWHSLIGGTMSISYAFKPHPTSRDSRE